MNHDHPGTRLTFGCAGCIEQVKRDQFTESLPHMDVDELVELLMGREHIHDDWQCRALTAELARRDRAAS